MGNCVNSQNLCFAYTNAILLVPQSGPSKMAAAYLMRFIFRHPIRIKSSIYILTKSLAASMCILSQWIAWYHLSSQFYPHYHNRWQALAHSKTPCERFLVRHDNLQFKFVICIKCLREVNTPYHRLRVWKRHGVLACSRLERIRLAKFRFSVSSQNSPLGK